MQRVNALALLVVLAFSYTAHISAAPAPAATVAAAPAPSVVLTNTFQSANISKPDALVRRVEAGVSVPANPTGLVCVIHLAGQGLMGPVDATSLDPSTQATGLKNASIQCTGDDSAIIEGGSALAQFVGNFSGRSSP